MYKETETTALRLMRRGQKLDAPPWLLSYCFWAIDRARFYRRAADDKDACQQMGKDWRGNRFKKAIDTASHAADVMEAFIREARRKTPNVGIVPPRSGRLN